MALDLGLTTRQLLSAPDDVALDIRARSQRLDAVTDRAFKVSSDEAAFRTAAVGRRPYTSPPAPAPRACWAVARRRTCPKTGPRCHLINQGGCVITYGRDFGSQLFSEPALAVADADLYLRKPDDPSDEVLIAGPLLGALRTVREVERLADPVEQLPDDKPALALLDGTLACWDLQRSNYPRYVADVLIAERLQPALVLVQISIVSCISERPTNATLAARSSYGEVWQTWPWSNTQYG